MSARLPTIRPDGLYVYSIRSDSLWIAESRPSSSNSKLQTLSLVRRPASNVYVRAVGSFATVPPSPRGELALGLHYYATLSPHQGLDGATPAEIYFGLTPPTVHAVSPPRASSRDPVPTAELPFALVHLDPERRLPFLIPRKRAA